MVPAYQLAFGSFLLFCACAREGDSRALRRRALAERVEAEQQAYRSKQDRIEAELARTDRHPWAGIYHCTGVYVVISPTGEAIWASGMCMNEAQNHGRLISVDAERMRFEWAIDPELVAESSPCSNDWVRIPWHGEQFLVPHDWMQDFCGVWNSGSRVYSGFPRLVRSWDQRPDRRFEDRPPVPERYQSMLLDEAVSGRCTSTRSWRRRDGEYEMLETRGRIELAPGHRLLAGMQMFGPRTSMRMGVVEVGESWAVVEVVSLVLEGEALAVGDELSTWMPPIEPRDDDPFHF